MKLLKKDVGSDGVGRIRVQPENDEDMWHLYNLLAKGDVVTAVTFRKVDLSGGNASAFGGSTNQQRVKMTLSVKVEAIEYDGKAIGPLARLFERMKKAPSESR